MILTLIVEEIIHEGDVRYDLLIKVALALSSDSVANVRIALCEMLSVLGPLIKLSTLSIGYGDQGVELENEMNQSNSHLNKIVNTLNTLELDVDRDVKYYAAKAKSSLDGNHEPTLSPFISSLFRRKSEENKQIVTELDDRREV